MRGTPSRLSSQVRASSETAHGPGRSGKLTAGPLFDAPQGSSQIMPTVTVDGEKSFEVEPGKKLVLAIEDAGIDIMHRCGGNARCTTCRVEILGGDAGPQTDIEQARLAREGEIAPNIRLSCQVHVHSDLWVAVINRAMARGIPAGPRPAD